MSQKFTVAYFVAVFSAITYYFLFYSHLEPVAEVPVAVTLINEDKFYNQVKIDRNKLCFLEDKSEKVAHNETASFQRIEIQEEKKIWALLVDEGELGTNLLPTDESELVVTSEGIWEGYEEGSDYCKGRYAETIVAESAKPIVHDAGQIVHDAGQVVQFANRVEPVADVVGQAEDIVERAEEVVEPVVERAEPVAEQVVEQVVEQVAEPIVEEAEQVAQPA